MKKRTKKKKTHPDTRDAKVLVSFLEANAREADKAIQDTFRYGRDLCERILTRSAGAEFLDFEGEVSALLWYISLKLGERRGFLNAAHDVLDAPAGATFVRRTR